jgi:hypothetical protein
VKLHVYRLAPGVWRVRTTCFLASADLRIPHVFELHPDGAAALERVRELLGPVWPPR